MRNDSQPAWQTLPFDAGTNFSLLGWILDKFGIGSPSSERIDLTLDEAEDATDEPG